MGLSAIDQASKEKIRQFEVYIDEMKREILFCDNDNSDTDDCTSIRMILITK